MHMDSQRRFWQRNFWAFSIILIQSLNTLNWLRRPLFQRTQAWTSPPPHSNFIGSVVVNSAYSTEVFILVETVLPTAESVKSVESAASAQRNHLIFPVKYSYFNSNA